MSDFQQAVAEAEQLAEQQRFDEAASRLRQLTRSATGELKQDIERLQPKIEAWESEFEQSRVSIKTKQTQAELALEQCDYEAAAHLLSSIPEAWRTDQTRELLSRTRRTIVEVKRIRERIEAGAKAKKHLTLLPDIDRLLQLSPADIKVRRLAEGIRDKLLVIAKRSFEEGKVEDAWKAVSRILPFVMNDDTEKLSHVIAARCWLIRDLQRASHVDRTLVDIANRLQKQTPDHPAVRKLAATALQRASKVHEVKPLPLPRWANVSSEESAFPRLEYFSWHEAFDGTECLPATGGYHACRFAVAAGLALQGINRAAVKSDLNQAAKKGWIGKVKSLGRKDSVNSIGMHIGGSSLKVVRLEALSKDAKPRITAALLVPFERTLGSVTSDFERRDLIRNAVIKAKQSCDLTNAPIVVSNAAIPVLARFIDLPPVDEKKVKATIEKEAAHQIPFPLDEVNWTYHIYSNAADSSRRQLTLQALKRSELTTFLEMVDTLDLHISIVQSDGAALHNLCEFVRLDASVCKSLELPQSRTTLMLHAGADGSTLVASRPDRLWFRYLAHGGARLDRSLAVEFKVTQEQAEQIKLMPARQPHVHRVYRSLQRPLREFSQEIERSLEASRRDALMPAADVLLLSGGATQLHGFYRMLHMGPESLNVASTDDDGPQRAEMFENDE